MTGAFVHLFNAEAHEFGAPADSVDDAFDQEDRGQCAMK